jgi:VWFA-related protein
MTRRVLCPLAVTAAFSVLASVLHGQQPQTPVFRSSVEVTSIDVGVVDNRGRPVTDLRPEEFIVQIDGAARRVVSAEWISLVTPPKPDAPPPPPGYSTNENSTGGRLILLVIDQPNIRFGGAVVIRTSVNGFLEHLQPSDRVAVIGLGPGGPPSTPFTADRRRLQETVSRMVGQKTRQSGMSSYNVTLSEALAIQRGEPGMLDRVINRECEGEPAGPRQQLCASSVENEAITVVTQGTSDGDQTLASLRALLEAVKNIDAPKTLILVTEGFLMGDRLVDVQNLGSLAAAARTSIYALRLDDVLFSDITDKSAALTRFEDRQESRVGVETLANSARGSLFNISVSADEAFERIESELSGYYILGVESAPADKDGKPHPIRVSVKRPGTTIRSRRQVMTAGDLDHPRTPREAVMGALASPMMVSALPLTVATFPLQGPDPAKIQLLMHAAVGSDYSSTKVVTFAYTITDAQGRIVESLGGDSRLSPVVNNVPSPLQYDVASSLPPGEYTLKLAMAEGERVGTIEHPIHAWLTDAPPVRLSEFMVGGPVDVRDFQRPTIGYTVAFGSVHGYLEAYGNAARTVEAKYEIAEDAKGAALLSENVPGRPAGADRTIFSKVMLVRQLPPGKYVLRAILTAASGPVKTLTRDFEIAAPPVLMTSANVAGTTAATELYLPVGQQLFARGFRPEEALRAQTVQAFRERVAVAARQTFDDGIALMQTKEYAKAERTLKTAIRGDTDSMAALTYLGATFAAAGYDAEATSSWQTALVEGSDFPDLYRWLGDAFMRTRKFAEARAIFEEATEKWPADVQFAKPLAYLYATFGQGREAVRTLHRYLAEHPEDAEANYLGVQWIYELHQAGAFAQTRAEDLKAARGYAAAYEKAKGPQIALVRQWIAFLEKSGA